MHMVQLIYSSQINPESFPPDAAQTIQKRAAEFNSVNALTGVLFCDGNFFMQALEGSRCKVSELFCKIASDSRHKNVTLLRFQDIAIRDFHNWSMKLLTYNSEKMELLKKFSTGATFDPFTLSSESSHSLLCQLAALDNDLGVVSQTQQHRSVG